MAKRQTKAIEIDHVFTQKEATTVYRPETGPYVWPDLVHVMVSDSFKVLGWSGMGIKAANGDPLSNGYAANMLETLYKQGYAVVRLKEKSKSRRKE